MNTRDVVCDAFDSVVDGIAKRCEVDVDKKAAVEIAADVLELTNGVVAAIADDGKMDEDEKARIKAAFREKFAQRVPAESFWFLGTIWGIVKKWLQSVHEKIVARIRED